MENESAFLIVSPSQISSKLSILLKNRRLITVYFGENNEAFVTTLLEVDRKANVFICDGCKEQVAERVLSSQKFIFETEHLGAKVVFSATKFTKVKYEENLAFSVPIPETMRWMEHREYHRLKTSISIPSFCELRLPDHEPISLSLYDISLRGFSVLIKAGGISELLVPDAHFDKCKLTLADAAEYMISFDVKNKFIINPDKLNEMEKIGCQFTLITPTFEDAIQRYMLQIEREMLKKKELGMVIT